MAALSGKTPISFLQEVCVKRGVTPVYELVANEGPVHEPLFVFHCQAGSVSASGRGTSKRKAKHNAAQSALHRMVSISSLSEMEQKIVEELRIASASESVVFDKSNTSVQRLAMTGASLSLDDDNEENGVNPVGSLQEICQHSLWPQPSYEFSCDNGPVHMRMFTCSVHLWRWSEEATGKSKKLAKRRAALKMAHKISSEKLTIPPEELEQLDEAHIPIVDRTDVQCLSEAREEPLSIKASKEINRFYNGLKSRGGGLLPIMSYKLNKCEDSCAMLEDLGQQHKFTVTYVRIPCFKTDSKDNENEQVEEKPVYQILLQLGTLPVAVMHGSSTECELDARQAAAFSALEYLLLMTNTTFDYSSLRDD